MDFKAIISKIAKTLKIHESFSLIELFDNFDERYDFLSQYKGLEKLLEKFTQEKLPDGIGDILTEFNIIYEILIKNPMIEIQYEPIISGSKKRPDFRIVIENQIVYIQVKRMRKSVDYESQFKANPNSATWYCVQDEDQVKQSLNTACSFGIPEKDALLVVIQEITEKVNIGDITHSQSVFGTEEFVIKSDAKYVRRKNDGFFFTAFGKNVCACITLRKDDGLKICCDYKKFLFLSPLFCDEFNVLEKLFSFSKIYRYEDLPDN